MGALLQRAFHRLDSLGNWPHRARALVFVVALVVFAVSEVQWIADSYYSILLSESLLRHGSPVLDRYFVAPLDPHDFPGIGPDGLPNHLVRVSDHLHYYFPPGSSVLSVPFVAAFHAIGLSAVDDQGRYYKRGEAKIQRILSAALMALFCVLVYEIARSKLPPRWSFVVAAVTAFGTPVWSTATRALWSQTWTLLLIGAAAYVLVVRRDSRPIARGAWLGSLLAWAYFTRPTASVPLAAVGVFLLLYDRRSLPAYAISAAAWGVGFVAYSWHYFGTVLPPYYQANRLEAAGFPEALIGHSISPSRGVLVFIPQLFVVAALLVRYRSELREPALLALSLAILALHVAVISSFPGWWAGYCYGPRLITEALPWLVVPAVLAIDAWLRTAPAPTRGSSLRGALAAALIVMAIAIHAPAAWSRRTKDWCALPVDVNTHQARLWDWSDPQFLAWIRARPGSDPGAR
jgi:hypothetical protein